MRKKGALFRMRLIQGRCARKKGAFFARSSDEMFLTPCARKKKKKKKKKKRVSSANLSGMSLLANVEKQRKSIGCACDVDNWNSRNCWLKACRKSRYATRSSARFLWKAPANMASESFQTYTQSLFARALFLLRAFPFFFCFFFCRWRASFLHTKSKTRPHVNIWKLCQMTCRCSS